VRAVESYGIVDTPPELAYDDIARLAAHICACPVGFINFIADTREWLKAKYGLPATLTGAPRGTVCSTTICQSDLLVVPDLAMDERFSKLPYIGTEPFFRFYCAMPLINPEGYALGTLCVIDFQPRKLDFEQEDALRRLSRQVMGHLELRRRLIELDHAYRQLAAAQNEVMTEKARSEELLLNILPAKIAQELKQNGRVEPRYHGSVTIMFADFHGFTRFAESLEPRRLVDDLDQYFSAFDEIIERHNVEKIKTIGDAYMCVGGLPEENETHPVDVCLAALEVQDFMARANHQRSKLRLPPWELRVGIHSGAVMAGVVGKKKFTYDVWGDAVNIAALTETSGRPGGINLSESTYHRVKNLFDTEYRGSVEGKSERRLAVYSLVRIKAELCSDEAGRIPNDAFLEVRQGLKG
jgi:class 3 adenylate cyclase